MKKNQGWDYVTDYFKVDNSFVGECRYGPYEGNAFEDVIGCRGEGHWELIQTTMINAHCLMTVMKRQKKMDS